MQYDLAISLGIGCQSRYHISRIMYLRKHGNFDGFFVGENKKNITQKYDYGTFFFDWSVTPIESVAQILENDFEGVFELDNLEIIQRNDHSQTVVDRAYGQRYPHTFPEALEGRLTYETLREHYAEKKEKFDYLVEKTKLALNSSQTILFVLYGNAKEEAIYRLLAAIEQYTQSYKLLYVPFANSHTSLMDQYKNLNQINNVIVHAILDEPYPGDENGWEKAFEEIRLNLPR